MKHSIVFTLLAIMLILNACKKDTGNSDYSETNAGLQIQLSNSYMPPEKIDSAIVVWEINGQMHSEHMHLYSNRLEVPLKNFSQGYGKLTIQLFTKTKLKNFNLQWEKEVNITLVHTKSIILSGPSNIEDSAWFPRLIMIDQATNFTAIVALNPSDSYFRLINIPRQWNKLELERGQ